MALKDNILDRAQKFMQKGAFDKALIEYRAACDVDPRDISIRLRIGDLYVKMNRKTEAIKEYTEVDRANSQRGFYLKAIAVYKQVLKLDDSILEVHYKLAELYTKQRLIADAISSYSTIVKTFERKGKTSEVMELLKKMSEIDPENIGVRLKLADLYQKLSFEKDALAEYSVISSKLVAQRQFDKAERIYLNIYSSKPREPEVLSGLSDLYRKKGDDQQYLRFAKDLFYHYRDSDDTDAARGVAVSILEVRPDEGECLRFLKSISRPEPIKVEHVEAPEPKPVPEVEEPLIEFPAGAAEPALPEPVPEEKEAAQGSASRPLISWPEEEIEISLEGFEAESDVATRVPAAEPEAKASPPIEEELGEIEIEIEAGPDAAKEAQAAVASLEALSASQRAAEETVSGAREEEKAEEPALVEFREETEKAEEPAMEFQEAVTAEPSAPSEPPFDEEPAIEFREGVTAEPSVPSEPPFEEEPVIEFRESVPEAEWPVAGVEGAGAVTEEAAPEEKAQAPLTDIGEEEISERLKDEAAVPVVDIEATPEAEVRVEEAAGAEAVIEEEMAAVEAAAEPVLTEAEPADAVPEPVEAPWSAPVEAIEAVAESALQSAQAVEEPLEAVEEVVEEPEAAYDEGDEDLSDAISELMEKIDGAEAESAPTAKIEVDEKVEAEDKIFPEVRFADTGEKITEESAHEGKGGYVDLSAELSMEEALEDLAGSWGGGGAEAKETFDEFKKGIGKQLSREDSETHYNLGIAYMEMELYNEAAKEFKIALKDPRLEFDCYIRLGLCSMADANPDEAIIYYLKGLKIEGKTDDERKGMMYELALAYEAAGDGEEATHLFRSVYDMDPGFREVSEKAAGALAPFVRSTTG